MASLAKKLEAEVAAWPNVTVRPHQVIAREFRFNKAEIGHVHFWGDVDIPFTPALHDLLLAQGRAERHRWLPDSGWVTYHLHNESNLSEAAWLMRLSYLRYALKAAPDPEGLLRDESERMGLSPEFQNLMAQFRPARVVRPGLLGSAHEDINR